MLKWIINNWSNGAIKTNQVKSIKVIQKESQLLLLPGMYFDDTTETTRLYGTDYRKVILRHMFVQK
jgi:hypothetical protein